MEIETEIGNEIEIEIPCYFLCPISMQMMRDPVTVSTGITYDRQSIEKWLFSCKNVSCPVTKQPVRGTDLTPNHTLRRLIQAWCTVNAVDRIPTPKAPLDRSQIVKLIDGAKDSKSSEINCLHRLRSIAHRDESSRNQLQSTGAVVDFLSSVLVKNTDAAAREEAIDILQRINLSDSDLKKLAGDKNGEFMDSLMRIMESGSYRSRAHAIILLKSVFHVADPDHLIGTRPKLFTHISRIIADKISPQATKSALQLLVELCPWGRNRVKAAEGGAVSVLIELLLETAERRVCELVLAALDQLCRCAEGRSELLQHGAGLAVVSKKILRVSRVGSERAVRILSSISSHSANSRVLDEMLQVGVVSKLCLVLQVEGSERSKDKAREILRLHSRVWRSSSCIPSHLITSYPYS